MNEQYYYIDEAGMIVVRGDDQSWKDDRNHAAMVAYPKDKLKYYLPKLNCIRTLDDPGYKMIRHPNHFKDKTMSRDHFIYIVLAVKEMNDKACLAFINEYLKWKISDLHNHRIDSWLFCKGITGTKWAMWLWFRVARIVTFGNLIWNSLLYRIAPFYLEDTINVYTQTVYPLTKLQKKLRTWLYPIYSLESLGWQLRATPNCKAKVRLKRLGLRLVPRYNHLLRLLFGNLVHPAYIINYQSCTSWRSGVALNGTCRRHIRKLTEEEKGNLDLEKDLLTAVYEESI